MLFQILGCLVLIVIIQGLDSFLDHGRERVGPRNVLKPASDIKVHGRSDDAVLVHHSPERIVVQMKLRIVVKTDLDLVG